VRLTLLSLWAPLRLASRQLLAVLSVKQRVSLAVLSPQELESQMLPTQLLPPQMLQPPATLVALAGYQVMQLLLPALSARPVVPTSGLFLAVPESPLSLAAL